MELARAQDALRTELDKTLNVGSYTSVFLNDVFDLWTKEGISPDVILREIRALEGLGGPLVHVEGDEPVPIYFIGGPRKDEPDDAHGAPLKPDAYLNRSTSATKGGDQGILFDRKKSPLKGLWHKHYYVHRADFLQENIKNQNARREREGVRPLSPIMAMMTRFAESAATGEWIVFKKEAAHNTYLCLAKHTDDDNTVYDRIKSFI